MSGSSQAKVLDAHRANAYNITSAGVAESADAADLKSAGATFVGSSPTPGTTHKITAYFVANITQ